MLGGFLALDELGVRGGQSGDGFALRLHLLVGAGELQHAALVVASAAQALPVAQRIQVGSARDTGEDAVVRRDDRMESAGVIAGGFLRRLGAPLVELDFPAARTQALADRGAGEAGADDDGLSLPRNMLSVTVSGIARGEHLALAAESRALLDREARR